MKTAWFRSAFLSLALLIPGLAQQNAGDRSLTLDVAVTDKSGKPVSGLQQQDFTLLDNKQPRKITSFRALGGPGGTPDAPVEVVLLIDEVNTAFLNVSSGREQVKKFLRQNGGELSYPVSLLFLTDKGMTTLQTPSRDGNALAAELNSTNSPLRTITRSQGFYGAGDRVQLSISALEQFAENEMPKPGRKLAVWISPGWPLLSGPNVELSARDRTALFNSVVRLSGALERARITLYAVDPLGTSDSGGLRTYYYQQFTKGVRSEKSVQVGNLGLQVFATQSGGLVLNSNNDVTSEIDKCVADAAAYYEISFDTSPGDGPNEYHAIETKVDKHGVSARTRSGYYAQPAQVPTR